MYIYVEEIYREWWIFENVDVDNVEWSEISGKKNWKNLLFISLSLFSLRGKIDFLLSLKFVCSCFNFKPQNLFSWMLLVNAHHSGREREIQTPLAICIPPSQYISICEKNYYSTKKKKFIDGGKKRDKNRGNLIRWNCTFQIHNAMMIYLLSCLWHFSQITLVCVEIDIMINIRFVFHPSHSALDVLLLSFVSRFDNLLSDYFPFYMFFDIWHRFDVLVIY